ncbi:MAG TPA: glycoside hydrolase family 15 protein, partial [Candidatus Thermoplasmatota archaeon]|nr:glycoside hydrolase family 15 protein [Candidatus Thermoplasmatota archaeon]
MGDRHTAALVGLDGSIDWFCTPHFDSPSVFGRILDHAKGGHWSVQTAEPVATRQMYLPETNVLSTRFLAPEGMADLTDFMPLDRSRSTPPLHRIVRMLRVRRGSLRFRVHCQPAFGYGGKQHRTLRVREGVRDGWHAVRFEAGEVALVLESTVPLRIRRGSAVARFRLREGEGACLVLRTELHDRPRGNPPAGAEAPVDGERGGAQASAGEGDALGAQGPTAGPQEPQEPQDPLETAGGEPGFRGSRGRSLAAGAAQVSDPQALLDDTIAYWRDWLSACTYQGRWREHVQRSALTLKLLTYEPTGAIVAAPTTSLPERIGGPRNWDYRYAWVRDASFILHALLEVGFTEEADHFMQWLLGRVQERDPDETLRPLYGVHGEHRVPESVLPHLEGYRGSAPVRVGNDAYEHLQLDLYGALFEALWLYERGAPRISHGLWQELAGVLDWLTDHWKEPDQGIWETRSGPEHHTFSKMMCWVAFDRGLRISTLRGFPGDRQAWTKARDEVYEAIMAKGWDEGLGSFVQAFGGTTTDASLLLMPLVGFLAPRDPRMLGTIRAVQRKLAHGPLVRRYDTQEVQDGVGGAEGAFTLCGFWLVTALTRAGRVEEARRLFDELLGFANHLGL